MREARRKSFLLTGVRIEEINDQCTMPNAECTMSKEARVAFVHWALSIVH
jgi:hypothetical protein